MSAQDFEVVQERDRVQSRRIVTVVTGAVLVAFAGVLASALLLRASVGSIVIDEVPSGQKQRPATLHIGEVLQSSFDQKPRGHAIRAAQEAELRRYRWIDRDAGVVQIPVDRAIDVVVERAR